MRDKSQKIKKVRKDKIKKSASSVLFMGLSFFLTIALFIGLVIAQNLLTDKIIYKEVLIERIDIPRNTIITEDNIEAYFTKKNINILDVTSGNMTDKETLLGKKAIVPLYAGESVSEKDFEDLSKYIEGFENPVELSIQIPDIASADGGKLREGDLINLTMMFTNEQLGKEDYKTNPYINSENYYSDPNSNGLLPTIDEQEVIMTDENVAEDINVKVNENSTEEKEFEMTTSEYRYETWAQYVMENLYIHKALDSSGIEIDPTDTEASASILIFIIDKSNEADLNNALANCTAMRISKCYDKPGIAYVDISVVGENGNIISQEHVQSEVSENVTKKEDVLEADTSNENNVTQENDDTLSNKEDDETILNIQEDVTIQNNIENDLENNIGDDNEEFEEN